MNTYLYWIHYPHHTDPFTQGYIGVSNSPDKRFKYHSSEQLSDNNILFHSIKQGAKQTIIGVFDNRNDALLAEQTYRPSDRIGWNIIAGGVSPPNQSGSSKPHLSRYNATKIVSKQTKDRMSASGRGRKWFTNGKQTTKCFECPEGFFPGRAPRLN